jgi:hypothetical protein
MVIPTGQTSTTFVVKVRGDRLDEDNESFGVNLAWSGTTLFARGTIIDDDEPASANYADDRQPAAQTVHSQPIW